MTTETNSAREIAPLLGYYSRDTDVQRALKLLRRECKNAPDFPTAAAEIILGKMGIVSIAGLRTAGLFSIYPALNTEKTGEIGVAAQRVHLSMRRRTDDKTLVERRFIEAFRTQYAWTQMVALVRTLQRYDNGGLNYYQIYNLLADTDSDVIKNQIIFSFYM